MKQKYLIMTDIINKAMEVLQSGGTILYPTDTVWGIGCDATDGEAVKKVFHIKCRDDAKSLIILLPEAKDIFKYVSSPPPDIISIIGGFERPTTVIYDQAVGLPQNLINQDGSIAIRVISEPFCKSLLKRFKKPIVSTSANISGMPTPKLFSEISDEIRSSVDYVVPYRQDETTSPPPSRIIKIDAEGNINIIRN